MPARDWAIGSSLSPDSGRGAPAAPESRGRVRGLAVAAGGWSRAVSRWSRWRRRPRRRRLVARRGEAGAGTKDFEVGIREFLDSLSGILSTAGSCRFRSVEERPGREDRRQPWCGGKRRPAAARCGDPNQQVPAARRGRGGRARSLPHTRRPGSGGTRGCSVGCPGQRPAAEGVSPTFVPRWNAAWPCPLPLLWQGTHLARVAGARQRVSCPLCPRPQVRESQDCLRSRSGKWARRSLSFGRRNAVSVPLPDSAPGIRLLIAFFKQINICISL